MEKFRQFGDGGTGVNPFTPLWSNRRSSLAVRGLKGLVLLPVALVRLTIFMMATAWLGLTQLVCALVPIGAFRYPIYRVLTYVGCNVALLALGVIGTGASLADHRRLKVQPPKCGGASVFDARRGTLVFTNQQGLTDVLYLAVKVCPMIFVFPASDGTPAQLSLLGALRRMGARRPAAVPAQPVSLAEMSLRAKSGWQGPVVVFAEGARTNGSCVLKWKEKTFSGVESFEKPVGTALVTLEYSKTGAYTPHHTVGTTFRHIFWLCMQPWHTVRATWLPATDVANAVRGKPILEQVSLLRSVLTRMVGPSALEVDVGAEKHPEFMAYWDAAQRKGYTQRQSERKQA